MKNTKKGLSSFFNSLGNLVEDTVSMVSGTVENVVDGIADTMDKAMDGEFDKVPESIANTIGNTVEGIVEGTVDVVDSAIDTGHKLTKTMIAPTQDLRQLARDVGEEIAGDNGKKIADIITLNANNSSDDE